MSDPLKQLLDLEDSVRELDRVVALNFIQNEIRLSKVVSKDCSEDLEKTNFQDGKIFAYEQCIKLIKELK